MKVSPSGPFLLLLFLSSIAPGLTSVVSKNSYTDLATIYTQSNIDNMDLRKYYAWIAPRRNSTSGQNDWISNEIDNTLHLQIEDQSNHNENCAAADFDDQKIHAKECENHFFYICQEIVPVDQLMYVIQSIIFQAKTWAQAGEHCRELNGSLASYSSYQWSSGLLERDFPVWIGLHKEGNSWTWSTSFSKFLKWRSGEPSTNGDCVSITSLTKKMTAQNCSTVLPFVCISENVFLVKENKTWEEALERCRGFNLSNSDLHFDLLSVEPKDHEYVWNKVMEAETKEVWTGLRFLAGEWFWVNGEKLLYSGLYSCPIQEHRCGAFSKDSRLETRDCSERKNFLCYSYKP